MKTSESLTNISKALVDAHKEISHPVKDAKNPHFKNDYATLESVIDASKPALLKYGIITIQSVSSKSLITRLQHVSGEYYESELELLVDKNNMQGLGSAITYARRYSLAAMLNISQADDDGNSAASAAPQPQKTTQAKPATKSNDYIINLGDKNKMTGTKFSDHTPEWIKKSIDSTLKWHQDNNKALHKNTQEFVEKATEYLKTIPGFDSGETLPF